MSCQYVAELFITEITNSRYERTLPIFFPKLNEIKDYEFRFIIDLWSHISKNLVWLLVFGFCFDKALMSSESSICG